MSGGPSQVLSGIKDWSGIVTEQASGTEVLDRAQLVGKDLADRGDQKTARLVPNSAFRHKNLQILPTTTCIILMYEDTIFLFASKYLLLDGLFCVSFHHIHSRRNGGWLFYFLQMMFLFFPLPLSCNCFQEFRLIILLKLTKAKIESNLG